MIITRIVLIFIYCLLLSACIGGHALESASLPISNEGVEWTMGWDVIKVRVTGDVEQAILRIPTPPLEALLACLNDEGKWKAAHVLLTMRYEKQSRSSSTHWNGLSLVTEKPDVEMNKIRTYWMKKHLHEELMPIRGGWEEEYINRWW